MNNFYTSWFGKNSSTGFTLIELLVVVLIIGILASVALPQYTKAVEKSRVGAALAFGRAVMTAENAYYLANGEYTTDKDSLDLDFSACPKDFTCYFGNLVTAQKFEIVRKNGPFAYNIIFSMDKRSFSDSAGKIYCAALKANPQAVAFCKSFGPAEITANDEWVRHIIQ